MESTKPVYKMCGRCGQSRPLEDFHVHRGNTDGRQDWCKVCLNKYNREQWHKSPKRAEYVRRWNSENKEKRARTSYVYRLREQYGMEMEDYERLLAEQGGGCGICGRKKPTKGKRYFCVDHCHETGKVRGLLCYNCNVAVGHFRNSVALLEKAIGYLRKT